MAKQSLNEQYRQEGTTQAVLTRLAMRGALEFVVYALVAGAIYTLSWYAGAVLSVGTLGYSIVTIALKIAAGFMVFIAGSCLFVGIRSFARAHQAAS